MHRLTQIALGSTAYRLDMADQNDQSPSSLFEQLRQLSELLEQNGQIMRDCREVAEARREVQETWRAEDDAKFDVLRAGLQEMAIADRERRRRKNTERRESAEGIKEAIVQELDRGHRVTTEMVTSLGQECRGEKEECHWDLLGAIRGSRQS